MPLVEMVRRQHRWGDSCIGFADQRLSEALIRSTVGLREDEEGFV
jgi:hypothetical protein